MTKNEYGTICLNLGFMSGMFFAASGDMPDEFARASNLIRAICSWQITEDNEVPESGRAQRPAPTTEPEKPAPEEAEKKTEAEFKRSVCERLDAFRQENKLGSFKELSKIVNYRISQDNIVRIFNREPVDISKYRILNTALNKWEEQKMKGDNTACQSES